MAEQIQKLGTEKKQTEEEAAGEKSKVAELIQQTKEQYVAGCHAAFANRRKKNGELAGQLHTLEEAKQLLENEGASQKKQIDEAALSLEAEYSLSIIYARVERRRSPKWQVRLRP